MHIELAALIEIVRLIDRPNFTGPGATPERRPLQAVSVPAQLGPIETVDSEPIGRGDLCIALEMVRALQP
jgi:hypothetical protein